jgi:hypothetical protein
MIPSASLKITPEILGFIAELDEFKGAWRALGTLAPERLSALRKVATIESIGSSTRIEGSKLSDREVEKLLANLEIKSLHTRDEQEVAGYAETMELIFQSWEEITLTETMSSSCTATCSNTAKRTRIIAANTRPNPTASRPLTRLESRSASCLKRLPRSTPRA